jgi:hypothetical protein
MLQKLIYIYINYVISFIILISDLEIIDEVVVIKKWYSALENSYEYNGEACLNVFVLDRSNFNV